MAKKTSGAKKGKKIVLKGRLTGKKLSKKPSFKEVNAMVNINIAKKKK